MWIKNSDVSYHYITLFAKKLEVDYLCLTGSRFILSCMNKTAEFSASSPFTEDIVFSIILYWKNICIHDPYTTIIYFAVLNDNFLIIRLARNQIANISNRFKIQQTFFTSWNYFLITLVSQKQKVNFMYRIIGSIRNTSNLNIISSIQ